MGATRLTLHLCPKLIIVSLYSQSRQKDQHRLAEEVGHEQLLALGLGLSDAHDRGELDVVGQGTAALRAGILAASACASAGRDGCDVAIVHIVVARVQLLEAVLRQGCSIGQSVRVASVIAIGVVCLVAIQVIVGGLGRGLRHFADDDADQQADPRVQLLRGESRGELDSLNDLCISDAYLKIHFVFCGLNWL